MAETDKSLKKLKRNDLLRLLVEQSRQAEAYRAESEQRIAELEAENAALRSDLESREIKLREAGSIADAAMQINDVFAAAQQAADQYLANLMDGDRELAIAQREAEADMHCNQRLSETEEACRQRIAETDRICEGAVEEAKKKIDAYWADLSERLVSLYQSYQGMQQFLSGGRMEPTFSEVTKNAVLLSDQDGEG